MLTINGESVSPIDPSQLPFTVNNAAGPTILFPIAVLITILTGTLNLLGYTHIPLYVVFAPPLLLALHVISFIRLRNAVHLALQMHAHDLRLNAMVAAQHEQVKAGHLSQDRLNAITRNAG